MDQRRLIIAIVVVIVLTALAWYFLTTKRWKLLYSFAGQTKNGITTYYALDNDMLGHVGGMMFEVDSTTKNMEKHIQNTILAKASVPFKYAVVEAMKAYEPGKVRFAVVLYDKTLNVDAHSGDRRDTGNVLVCNVGPKPSSAYGHQMQACEYLAELYNSGRSDSRIFADKFPIGPGIWEYS